MQGGGKPQILGREVPTGWDEASGICWQGLWEAEGIPLGCDSDSVHLAAVQPRIKSNKNSTSTAPLLTNLSSIPVFCRRCYFCLALSDVSKTHSKRRENKDTRSKEDYLNHILGEISPAYVYATYRVTQKCPLSRSFTESTRSACVMFLKMRMSFFYRIFK